MEFKDFVQILHPIIGGASSQASFVRTLFDVIVTEDGQSTLDEQTEVTYRSYFNGKTGISRIARKINPYIETENFVSYIHDFPDETVLSLCDSFREYLPEIDGFNAGRQLADLFLSILKNAAGTKRKSPAPSEDDTEPIDTEAVDGEMPSAAATEKQEITVIQQQITIVQNGEKNFNLTNNGTMNFSF